MDFEYVKINDGIKITKYIGAAESVTIPEKIEDLPVTEIGKETFYGYDNLILNISAKVKFGKIFIKPKTIQAEPSVDSIEFDYTILKNSVRIDAYTGTDTSIAIPATIENLPVTEIGNKTFSGCSSIKEIKIPDSVTEIGYKAFEGCSNLTEIVIPNSVKKLDIKLFGVTAA